MSKTVKRSDEPIWWALFSGGGVCFAVFVPAAVFFLALALPLGWIELSHAQALKAFGSIFAVVFVGAVIALPAFHAAHRIRHGLYDLKCQSKSLIKWLAYGLAFVVSAYAAVNWLIFTFC
ncbi:MAG: hypothetical protein QMB92_02655 [Thiopseudomonas sp.]